MSGGTRTGSARDPGWRQGVEHRLVELLHHLPRLERAERPALGLARALAVLPGLAREAVLEVILGAVAEALEEGLRQRGVLDEDVRGGRLRTAEEDRGDALEGARGGVEDGAEEARPRWWEWRRRRAVGKLRPPRRRRRGAQRRGGYSRRRTRRRNDGALRSPWRRSCEGFTAATGAATHARGRRWRP